MAHYLFNFVNGEAAQRPALREQAAGFLRVRMWGIDADEPHRDALAAGDLVLVYLGAPDREFIGRAELASAVHDWTPSEAQVYPGDSPSGVSLAQVEEWDPPVPMNAVLSQIDPAENARADFETGVVRITANEFETALAVATGRTLSTQPRRSFRSGDIREHSPFGPLGVTNIRTFVDPQNPTRVAVLMDVADMDAVMGAMETEAAAEAMEHDGVVPESLVILVEA